MNLRKRYLALAIGAMSAALAFNVATPAGAYPPGQTMLVAVSKGQVAKGTTVTVNVTRAKPGIVVVKFGTTTKRAVASSSYKIVAQSFKPAAAGIYVVSAKASDAESATAKVYVPSRTVATSARVGAVTNAIFRYVQPGTVVTVTVGSESYVGQVPAGKTTLVVPFSLDSTGANTVAFTVGNLSLPSASMIGK